MLRNWVPPDVCESSRCALHSLGGWGAAPQRCCSVARNGAAQAQGDEFAVVFSSGATDAGDCDGDRIGGVDSIESAVRRLVQLIRRQRPQSAATATGVLLDVQVDDLRCLIEKITPSPMAPAGGPLSRREVEVALMVAQGYPNKTIAALLEISSFTVSSYLRRIFAKLGVNSRAAMVAQALENNLLPGPITRAHPAEVDPPPGEIS